MQKEYEYNGKAMGTDFSISIVSDSEEVAHTCAQNAINTITSYESRFSRFLPESELSTLNRIKDMTVSDTFFDVVEEAHRLFVSTHGVFNPLVQIARLGYTKDFDSLETNALSEDDDEYSIDFTETRLNRDANRIILLPGQKLDFGGFLKGYLATRLAREIKNYSPLISGVIVNIGGDIHTEGLDEDGSKFEFTIFNPITGKDDILIPLKDGCLATSGIYKRAWERDGKAIHHILDPTGAQNPDTNIVSASVVHESGGTAEAYAKVFIALGLEKALTLLPEKHIHYLLITDNGDVKTNII